MKISKKAYQRLRQDELVTFAGSVLKRTKEIPAFAFMKNEVNALEQPLEKFATYLHAALNRGKVEIAAKNAAQKILLAALNKIADVLNANIPDEDTSLILEAGFTVPPTRSQRSAALLQAPVVLRTVSTGRKGELRVQLDKSSPGRVVCHAIEYSLDQGESWHNGSYHTQSNFVLYELPSSLDMQLRFRAIGKGTNKSPWSSPVSVGVL